MPRDAWRLTAAVSSFFLLFVCGAIAQKSSINGTVTDATGAVVPGAKVTVQDSGRNTTRSVTTSASGAYSALLGSGFVGRVLEGWTVSGITTLQSGFPFDVITLRDSQGSGSTQRADYDPHLAPAPLPAGFSPIRQTGPNAGLFFEPPYGTAGDSGRNHFRGPGVDQWNFVVAKNTKFNDRFTLEMRTEFYNLFNHPDFTQPDNLIEDGPGTFGQSFGQVAQNDSTTGARQIQVGLKLHF